MDFERILSLRAFLGILGAFALFLLGVVAIFPMTDAGTALVVFLLLVTVVVGIVATGGAILLRRSNQPVSDVELGDDFGEDTVVAGASRLAMVREAEDDGDTGGD